MRKRDTDRKTQLEKTHHEQRRGKLRGGFAETVSPKRWVSADSALEHHGNCSALHTSALRRDGVPEAEGSVDSALGTVVAELYKVGNTSAPPTPITHDRDLRLKAGGSV